MDGHSLYKEWPFIMVKKANHFIPPFMVKLTTIRTNMFNRYR